MSKIDITDKIERLEAMEERYGISLEALYCSIEVPDDDDDGEYIFELNGEIHSNNGNTIGENIKIVATLHDDKGRVIDKEDHYVIADNFFGLEAFDFYINPHVLPCKIRLYPTK